MIKPSSLCSVLWSMSRIVFLLFMSNQLHLSLFWANTLRYRQKKCILVHDGGNFKNLTSLQRTICCHHVQKNNVGCVSILSGIDSYCSTGWKGHYLRDSPASQLLWLVFLFRLVGGLWWVYCLQWHSVIFTRSKISTFLLLLNCLLLSQSLMAHYRVTQCHCHALWKPRQTHYFMQRTIFIEYSV